MPRRDPWVYIGLFAFFALLFVALFGERIAPHETIFFVPEHGRDPRPYDPGLVFPVGSDVLGRDLLSLVLAGARMTLVIVVLAGLARVAAGLILAGLAAWWPAARILGDSAAEMVAAVPASLVALLIVKVFVRGDTTFLLFVGALLVTGWAGPYRIMRAELDRLMHMGFTEGAAAIGVSRIRVFASHHIPHLVPLLAVNVAQQSVASLVALAELGVLGVFVGAFRSISIEESLSVVRVGQVNSAQISEPPEWGGLLANARTIESLWTTRWLFLVPGIAFAIAAVALAAIGLALSRHYARRNLLHDVRSRGALTIAAMCTAMLVVALVMPDRYAAAQEWAAAARSAANSGGDIANTFADAGLKPVGGSFLVERDVTRISKVAAASVHAGDVELRESTDGAVDVRAVVYGDSGGGRVEAPMVFVGWGIAPVDHPPQPAGIFSSIDFGRAVAAWPDDYTQVDVRGKVVILLRFTGVITGRGPATGPDAATHVKNAIKRGAAAVILVDPTLPQQPRVSTGIRQNLYQRIEQELPVERVSGVPVIVISSAAADRLLRPAGIVPSQLYAGLGFAAGVGTINLTNAWLASDSEFATHSLARDVAMRATVEVPLANVQAHVRTVVAESAAPSDAPRIVIWAVTHATTRGDTEPLDVLARVANAMRGREAPVVLVAFDPSVDASGNARMVAELLKGRSLGLFIVLDDLSGSRLSFRTPFGDLIPAFDHYADLAGAPHVITRTTVNPNQETWVWPGIAPFIESKAVLVTAAGEGDVRSDAAAMIGYVIGRRALDAEELPH